MKLKNRKRITMALLSLMLATTGCKAHENDDLYTDEYQEKCYDVVSSLLDVYDFYNEDLDYIKERYSQFYNNYLNSFIDYMSKDQYYLFIDLVENMNQDERNEYPNSLNYLNSMFNVTDSSYGRGFFKIFNTCVISENVDFTGIVGGDISNDVNTIIAIVNNNEELFPCIFSGDINEVIDCIANSTGFTNRDTLEELILKMDLYTDLISSNGYTNELVKKSYEDRIHEIVSMLIHSKCNSHPEFSKSLYMNILRESLYYDHDDVAIYPGITTGEFAVEIKDSDETYSVDKISKSYLYGNYSKEDLKAFAVNNILYRSFHLEDEEYNNVENTMQLLMCLLDSDITFENIKNGEDLRQILYSNLAHHFSSPDEFNTFVLKLYSKCPATLEQYFEAFIQSIKDNGITYDDFIRYSALVNYNNQRKRVNIDYVDRDNYIDKEDLANMTEEEYENIASSTEENYFLGYIDYQKYFDKIDKVLSSNDLGFSMINNKDCTYEWKYGNRQLVGNQDPNLISAEVTPEMMEYNGTYVIFYEYPKFYEEGEAVEVFKNINNETTTREFEGFKAEIIDPTTGNPRTIYVVDMGPSKDGYDNIRFMIDAKTFAKYNEQSEELKPILKGDNYE